MCMREILRMSCVVSVGLSFLGGIHGDSATVGMYKDILTLNSNITHKINLIVSSY